jgi:hypothetical protein
MLEDDNEEKTSKNQGFEDEGEEWGNDNDSDETEDTDAEDEEADEDSEEEESSTKDEKATPEAKKLKSAIAQKKAWRDRYLALKGSSKTTKVDKKTDDREVQAKQTLRKILKEIRDEDSQAEAAAKAEKLEHFQDELDTVLEKSSFTEDQILSACEKYDVTPKKAASILKDLSKVTSKEKKGTPSPKRSATKPDTEVKQDDKKPKTFGGAAQSALARLKALTKEG